MPLVELFFLIRAGQIIGLWNTIAVVMVTGILGASFARSQGRLIWKEVNEKLARGEMPADTVFHGFLVFAGGLLLITPGFVTDFIGLSMVMPGPRHVILRILKQAVEKRMQSGQIRFYQSNIHSQTIHQNVRDESSRPVREVIDIEAEEKE